LIEADIELTSNSKGIYEAIEVKDELISEYELDAKNPEIMPDNSIEIYMINSISGIKIRTIESKIETDSNLIFD